MSCVILLHAYVNLLPVQHDKERKAMKALIILWRRLFRDQRSAWEVKREQAFIEAATAAYKQQLNLPLKCYITHIEQGLEVI